MEKTRLVLGCFWGLLFLGLPFLGDLLAPHGAKRGGEAGLGTGGLHARQGAPRGISKARTLLFRPSPGSSTSRFDLQMGGDCSGNGPKKPYNEQDTPYEIVRGQNDGGDR